MLFLPAEFWEGNSAPTTAPVPESAAAVVDPDSIELKVQSADRRSTVMIRLKAADPMSLLMERYAAEKGVSLDQLRSVLSVGVNNWTGSNGRG